MTEEVIELKGEKPGPINMILVGVHGNEVCGPKALERILPILKIDYGTLYIAYGNIEAIKQNVRFIEENLNRMFKDDEFLSAEKKNSYEYKRSRFLMPYLDKAAALLDVHASYTVISQSFIICEAGSEKIAQYLPFDKIVSGFDEIEGGGTDGYMNKSGKVGICIECGYLEDPASTDVAAESIMIFLKAAGNIRADGLKKYEQKKIRMNDLYFTKTDKFVLAKDFVDFEEMAEGQIIGFDGEEEIKAPYDGIIVFARNREKVHEEAYCFGRYI